MILWWSVVTVVVHYKRLYYYSMSLGELSLMAALAANHLVRSHMQHNRKPATDEATPSSAAGPTAGVPLRKNSSMPDLST